MRSVYWLGLAAAGVAVADTIFYVILISRQDTPTEWTTVAFVASVIMLGAVFAAAGSLVGGNARMLLLAFATTILLIVGVLAILSIGWPLIFAGIVTMVGAVTATRGRRQSRRPAPPPRSASSRP